MSWWKQLLISIATSFGRAVADAGTERVTDKIRPKDPRDIGKK